MRRSMYWRLHHFQRDIRLLCCVDECSVSAPAGLTTGWRPSRIICGAQDIPTIVDHGRPGQALNCVL